MNLAASETAQMSQRDQRFHTASLYAAYSITGLIAIIFFLFLLPLTRPYAYTDDWTYSTPLKFATVTDFLRWVIAQHVDHRIPLQKASSYFILRMADFDFRYQVALNFIAACLLTMMLLYAARKYRGYQSLGDLIIPLTTLSFAAGFSLWGMLGQFLSSVFFAVCFLTACVEFGETRRHLYLDIAVICLILCALCGLNGLVTASVASVVFLVLLLWQSRKQGSVVRVSTYVLLATSLLLNLSVWSTWKPSAAARSSHSVSLLAHFMYGLVASCFGVYSFTGTWWKFGIVLLLVALALFVLAQRISCGRLSAADMAIMALLLASLALLAAISAGRAAFAGGWNPTFAFHYGYLSVLIPLLSWIVVSAHLPRKWGMIASLAVVLLFGLSFQANASWRFEYSKQAAPHQREVLADLQGPFSGAELADRRILDFYYVNTPATKSQVGEGIEAFRAIGASIYGKPVAAPSPSVTQVGAGVCRVSQLIGFQDMEKWGAWSREDPATIKLERAISGPLDVNLSAYAMNDHTDHALQVTIGGETRSVSLSADVPRTFRLQYALPQPANEIVLSGIEPISPKDAGLGLDERKLAVGLVSVNCVPEGKTGTP